MARQGTVRRRVLFALVLALATAGGAVAGDLPTLAVSHTETPPRLDGKLDDACWQHAVATSPFVVYDTGSRANVSTRAWVCADDAHLYIAFHCDEPNLAEVKTTTAGRDDNISRDDCVEVFLQPGASGYLHLLVNAAGVRGDRLCERGQRDRDWDGAWRSAVRRVPAHKDLAAYWAAEMAVPFHDLNQLIVPGRSWRVNLCRTRRAGGAPYLSWSRTPGGFHNPSRFGVLKGVPDAADRFALRIEDLRAGAYGLGERGSSYRVSARVFNRTGASRTVTAEAVHRPGTGQESMARTALDLPTRGSVALSVDVHVPSIERRTALLRLRDPQTGLLLARMPVDPNRFEPLLRGYMARSVYGAEPEAIACVTASVAGDGLRVRTTIADSDPAVVTTLDKNGRAQVPLPIADFALGKHAVTVTLLEHDEALGHVTFDLYKAAAARGRLVQADRERRIVLVDGEPFLPFGLYRVPQGELEEMADIGFNTVISWGESPTPTIEDQLGYLDAAHAAGLKVIDWPCRYAGRLRYADPEFADKFAAFIEEDLPELVAACRDHPAMLAWYSPDEPNLAAPYLEGGETQMIDLTRRYYQTVREGDPAHPMYGLFCRTIPASRDWQATYDVAGIDAYWLPLAKDETPLKPALAAQAADEVAGRYAKPFWLVLEAATYSASARSLSPAEQRCQTYLGLIHGAKGLLYFIYPVAYQPLLDEFRSLAAETHALALYVLSAEPAPAVRVEPQGLADLVHARAFRKGDEVVLLAANPSRAQAEVRISFEGIEPNDVEVPFAERALPIQDGAAQETIPGYGVRAYRIRAAAAEGDNASITIRVRRAQGAQSEPAAEREPPVPAAANLVPDPSFEAGDWTFRDWDRKYKNVEGELAPQPHTGQVSSWIRRSHVESAAQWISQWISLDPQTRYRLGGWMRSKVTEGLTGPEIFLLTPDSKFVGPTLTVPGKCVALPSGETAWTRHAADFRTGDAPPRVRVFCRLGHCKGEAWFDDVFLHEVTGEGVLNLLRNCSFEPGDLPGWPDWWRIFGHPEPGVRQGPVTAQGGPNWTFDTADPVHGTQCLRMTRTGPAENDAYRPQVTSHKYVTVTSGEDYAFSLYLKADRPETTVRLFIIDRNWTASEWTDVQVGAAWERKALTWTIPESINTVFVRFDLMTPATLWADAAQFEVGESAGPFTPPPEEE